MCGKIMNVNKGGITMNDGGPEWCKCKIINKILRLPHFHIMFNPCTLCGKSIMLKQREKKND